MFQEIACSTGPTGDPNCPPYVIKAKQINRQLVQMIDALSGGSEAERSEDGLSDASDSKDAGAGEFANVINEMNNAAGIGNVGEEEVDEVEDTDDTWIGVQGLVWVRGDEWQPDAAGNAGVTPPDGVTPAVARPSGRGPGRSRTLPASAGGVLLALLWPALLLPRQWLLLLPQQKHSTALGPVGQRQQVIEDVRFTL
jgi:hypothetical protein